MPRGNIRPPAACYGQDSAWNGLHWRSPELTAQQERISTESATTVSSNKKKFIKRFCIVQTADWPMMSAIILLGGGGW